MFTRIISYSYRFYIYQKILLVIVLYVKVVQVVLETMFYILWGLYLLDNYNWYRRLLYLWWIYIYIKLYLLQSYFWRQFDVC